MRVLFADDEAEFLAPLLKRLARRGFEAVGVASGEEALAAMDAQGPGREFDAVVLDVSMPGMGGMEALRILRQRHPRVPVLILTGRADMRDATAGLQSGAFCFLMKPVELDTLIWRLQDARMETCILRERVPGTGGTPGRDAGGEGRLPGGDTLQESKE